MDSTIVRTLSASGISAFFSYNDTTTCVHCTNVFLAGTTGGARSFPQGAALENYSVQPRGMSSYSTNSRNDVTVREMISATERISSRKLAVHRQALLHSSRDMKPGRGIPR